MRVCCLFGRRRGLGQIRDKVGGGKTSMERSGGDKMASDM